MHRPSFLPFGRLSIRSKVTPLAIAVVLSAATTWATLLPDPQFAAPVTSPFGLPTTPNSGNVTNTELGDLDGDGDLDLIVGSIAGDVLLFRNTGTPTVAAFAAPSFPLSGSYDATFPCFGDIDGDGDMDILVGVRSFGPSTTKHRLIRNTGNNTNPLFGGSETFPSAFFGFPNYNGAHNPNLADLDGDGDLDFITTYSYAGLIFFPNIGNSTTPEFDILDRKHGPFALDVHGESDTADFADLDGDGDLDAISTVEFPNQTIIFQRNVGSNTSPWFAPTVVQPFGLPSPHSGGPWHSTLGDLDGDGDIDLMGTRSDGGPFEFMFFRNTAPIDSTPPTASIARLGDTTTSSDTVTFSVQFSELVGNSFTSADVATTAGSLATSSLLVSSSPSDPNYTVIVILANPDIGGTIGIQVASSVVDIYENPMASSTTSSLFTITPPGDVNHSGALDLADVALLADVNLNLATLP